MSIDCEGVLYPYFTLFNVSFSSYIFTYALGYIIVGCSVLFISIKKKLNLIHVFRLSVFCVFFLIIGQRFFHFIIDGEMLIGTRFFGGLIFFILGGALYTYLVKLDFGKYMVIYCIFNPLAFAIGRIGCFLNGCCLGTRYHGVFAVDFPTVGKVHPVQLYESALYLILFFILLWLLHKKVKDRYLISIFVGFVSLIRFLAEYIRANAVWFLPWLSANQAFTLLTITFALAISFRPLLIKKVKLVTKI